MKLVSELINDFCTKCLLENIYIESLTLEKESFSRFILEHPLSIGKNLIDGSDLVKMATPSGYITIFKSGGENNEAK